MMLRRCLSVALVVVAAACGGESPEKSTRAGVASGSGATTTAHAHAGMDPAALIGDGLPGLVNGFELEVLGTLAAGAAQTLSFRVNGPAGVTTSFAEAHTKLMHTVVVRSDLSGYQHVHPVMAADGIWTVPVDLKPGKWRVIADASPIEKGSPVPVILGADVEIAGQVDPIGLPLVTKQVVVDDYLVTAKVRSGSGTSTISGSRSARTECSSQLSSHTSVRTGTLS